VSSGEPRDASAALLRPARRGGIDTHMRRAPRLPPVLQVVRDWARPARSVLGTMCVAFALLGCPRGSGASDVTTLPPIHTDDPVAEADLRTADEAADRGQLDEAREAYRAFLTAHPADPLLPLAHLGLARVFIDAGTPEQALTELDVVIAHPDPVIAERGRFWRGIALHLAGRSAEAIEALTPLVGRTTDPEETYLLLQTLAAAGRATSDHVTTLAALDELIRTRTDEAERSEARERARETVDSALEDASVARAYDTLPRDGEVWPMVAVRALNMAYDHGEVARVRAIAADLTARGLDLPDDARALLERTDRLERADPRVIGAVLPLSGEGRDVGRHALEGLMLAAGTPSDGPAAPDAPLLVFRDDGGDPARAAEAVEELITVHSAIAIIGPLTGPTARAAAERAAALGVPLITLTPVSTESTSASIFQLFPSLAEEADALVAAARGRGASRIVVLHAAGGYGNAMRAAIEAAAARGGATYVGAESYEPTATSFGPVITRLAARSFDAVVLADASARVALLAPALAAAGLTVAAGTSSTAPRRAVTVLVPSAGFDARLVRSAGRYLQGAIFGTLFSAATAEGEARSFVDAYTARFGSEPDAFAAYAHDAFTLIRGGVLSGQTTRGGMATYLSGTGGARTLGASSGLSSSRHTAHALRLVTLSGEAFTALH
jgi:branched-chain amino acid transport system substrate-binding protein